MTLEQLTDKAILLEETLDMICKRVNDLENYNIREAIKSGKLKKKSCNYLQITTMSIW